jgi:hypothetical protein
MFWLGNLVSPGDDMMEEVEVEVVTCRREGEAKILVEMN